MGRPILYVVMDGVGDLPTPEFENKTPLEAASTPNLDKLAVKGQLGIAYSVKRGIAPESDAGVFSLLSYDPSRLDLSRGVVEAMGSGIDFKTGDLALRCNFATVLDGQIVDRRAGRNVSTEEAKQLVDAVNGDEELRRLADFQLKATIGHRCAVVFRGGKRKLSSDITNLDPAYARRGKMTIAKPNVKLPTPIPKCRPLKKTSAARYSASLMNQFAKLVHQKLENHPVNTNRVSRGSQSANFLLMRDAGTKTPKVKTLSQKFGFKGIAVADMPVELGIAKVIGIDTRVFPPDRSLDAYAQRAKVAMELVRNYDLVYVHLKGPDEPGHDGDFEGKKKSIEDIDAGFFSNIHLDKELLCVTADHSTPCIAKGHSDDPVPLLVAGNDVSSDGSQRYTEAYAKKGKLGIVKHGYEIMGILKKIAG
ncbi:MAG TPA: alkaline phosphatase family protein [Candidatus Acidoferrales bacterium]|nr:alkaline phosphatase family protein [Candidatus Acidoferrales bacterium]